MSRQIKCHFSAGKIKVRVLTRNVWVWGGKGGGRILGLHSGGEVCCEKSVQFRGGLRRKGQEA